MHLWFERIEGGDSGGATPNVNVGKGTFQQEEGFIK